MIVDFELETNEIDFEPETEPEIDIEAEQSYSVIKPRGQIKHVIPGENPQVIVPDDETCVLNEVDVDAIPADYVGSDIPRRTSDDVSFDPIYQPDGVTYMPTFIAPNGYYDETATYSIPYSAVSTPETIKEHLNEHEVLIRPHVKVLRDGWAVQSSLTGPGERVTARQLTSGELNVTGNAEGIDVAEYATLNVRVPSAILQRKSVTLTPSTTQVQEAITPDTGYGGLSEVDVTVNAVPIATVSDDALIGEFVTQDNQRKWLVSYRADFNAGYTSGRQISEPFAYPAIAANLGIVPSTSEQHVGGPNTMLEDEIIIRPAPLQVKTVQFTPGASAIEAVVVPDGDNIGLSQVNVDIDAVPVGTIAQAHASGSFVDGRNGRAYEQELGIEQYGLFDGWETGVALGQLPALPANTTVTPTESTQTVGDAYYVMEGPITVNPIETTYVGSGVTRRSSSDLTASGATVTVPSGFYPAQATKSVASGTEGTPAATKGTVSNHAISVTPSVTNAAGYISGGTKTGTAVSVSAGELVSGTYTVGSSGTTDVTNYASVFVANGSATASAIKGTVNNHSMTVTPSVTRTAGYVTAGTANGTAVTVTASELASGNKAITQNGTNIDVVGYSTVSVDVQGGGSNWELIGSTTLTGCSTTSTSNATAGTISLGSTAFTKDAVIWVHVRDTAGKRAGYFYGSDAIFVNANKANSSTSTFTAPGVTTIRCTTSNAYAAYTGAYGVWGYSITSAGVLTIRKRYNSNYSLTVNGDYEVKVYKLTSPFTLFP